MKIVFLGTSATFPTKDRNHTAILLRYSSEALLFDCGEATQKQLRISGESPMKITKIFISHWHGDHVLGIPGLLQSMAMNNRKEPLEIFGPEGSDQMFWKIYHAFQIKAPYNITVHEIKNLRSIKSVCVSGNYEVLAMKVQHSIPCIAYAFQERSKYRIKKDFVRKYNLQGNPLLKKLQQGKDIVYNKKKIRAKDVTFVNYGKKVTIILDALYEEKLAKIAENADLLICEGTFSNKMREKVKEKGHMTVKQAAKVARKAKVKQLVLTHFSQRYKNLNELAKEAKSVFRNTKLAKDFMVVNV